MEPPEQEKLQRRQQERQQFEQQQELERQREERAAAPPHLNCPLTLAVHSYWFDLWLFVLFDLVLFAIVYLL